MQKITPFLWFENQAEEAMNYYVSVFSESPSKGEGSRVVSITRYQEGMDTPGMPQMKGKVLTGVFELAGQRFMALDGGPFFKFNEAVSLYVGCDNQEEVDYFWEKLSAVTESEQCGWLKDKFGLSWQIIPTRMEELMSDPDKQKAQSVVNAMLQMKKIDLAKLEKAAQE